MEEKKCKYQHGLFSNGELVSGQEVDRQIKDDEITLSVTEGRWFDEDKDLQKVK